MAEPLWYPGMAPVQPLTVDQIRARSGMPAPADLPAVKAEQGVGEPPFRVLSFEETPPPPAPKPASKAGLLSDTANVFMSGFDQLASDLRWATGKVFGDKVVKFIDDLGGTSAEKMKQQADARLQDLSPEMQSALGKEFITEKDGKYGLGDAWKDPRSYYGMVVQSLPGTLSTMGPTAAIARSIANRTLERALASGMAREAAEHAAGVAAQRAALFTGAALEGGQGAAQSGHKIDDEIRALPIEVLRTSQAFNDLVAGGMSEEKARAKLADDRSLRAMVLAGAATAAFGGQGDMILQRVLRGEVTGGAAKKILASMAAEGLLEEAPQSALQQVAENEAMRAADPRVTLGQGVLNQAVTGAIIGGLTGAGMGGIGVLGERPRGVAQTAAEAAGVPTTAETIMGAPRLPGPAPMLALPNEAPPAGFETIPRGPEVRMNPMPTPQVPMQAGPQALPYDPSLDQRDAPAGPIVVGPDGVARPQFRSEVPHPDELGGRGFPGMRDVETVPAGAARFIANQGARAEQQATQVPEVPRETSPQQRAPVPREITLSGPQSRPPSVSSITATPATQAEQQAAGVPAEATDQAPEIAPEKKSTFIADLMKAGGVLIDIASDVTGDRKTASKLRPGLFKGRDKGGMDADQIVEWAAQHGYITHAEAEDTVDASRKVFGMIRDAIERKVPIFKVGEEGGRRAADMMAARGAEIEASRQRAEQARRQEIEAEAQAERDAIQSESEALPGEFADAFSEAELDRIFARDDEPTTLRKFGEEPDVERPAEGPDTQAQAPAEAGPAEGAGEGQGDQARSQEGFALSGETPDEVRLREAQRERDAEAQRQRENAPPPEDFTLTGSNRPADQAEARGQTGLFDQPTTREGSEPTGAHNPGIEGSTPSPATQPEARNAGGEAERAKMEQGATIPPAEGATPSPDRTPSELPRDLARYTVEVPAVDPDTGAKGKVKENAADAMKRVDAQLEKARGLLACLRS